MSVVSHKFAILVIVSEDVQCLSYVAQAKIIQKQILTSKYQLDHQLHAKSRQERGQQDDPEGAETLPATDQH